MVPTNKRRVPQNQPRHPAEYVNALTEYAECIECIEGIEGTECTECTAPANASALMRPHYAQTWQHPPGYDAWAV